jgi:large subunit ribosomal protein L29
MTRITKELRSLSRQELEARLVESRKEMLKLNVQVATGNAANPGKLKQTKKNIARILTLMSAEVEK